MFCCVSSFQNYIIKYWHLTFSLLVILGPPKMQKTKQKDMLDFYFETAYCIFVYL